MSDNKERFPGGELLEEILPAIQALKCPVCEAGLAYNYEFSSVPKDGKPAGESLELRCETGVSCFRFSVVANNVKGSKK